MLTATHIGTTLDQLLAPLDDLYLVTEFPTQAENDRAYIVGMLAADLTQHAPSSHLLAICRHVGWDEGDALTIGRALASLIVRLAQQLGAE